MTLNQQIADMCRLGMAAAVLMSLSPLLYSQEDKPSREDSPDPRAGNEQVAKIMKTFSPRGVQSDGSQPTPPGRAVQGFRMKAGVDVDLVASEPQISQPLFLSWDSRGRMWVVQYRQYQYPAGLKVVRFDHHLRAVFDRVPEAPPNHTPGKDRITVFEDTDGDGLYDQHKDVITGLNIATSLAIGHGGIWVLNPPYLLFYPDADGDDVPDREPEVHLSGFGLQDTHSVANSMLWGPDGWLYGANGSTTGGTVASQATPGVTFQGQCIWRYHPDSKIFEIYAEGGGNTFSLEIDSRGHVFAGTNGGNTRGWHFPQGSYSRKNWGKHGPLTNPYAFGFFEPMKFEGDGRRFPQAFLVYEGGLFPSSYDGSIVAPNALQNLVWHSERSADGSSFQTRDLPNFLESSDRWFRPVYSGVGPDGAIYIADWYDTRLSHVSPTDDWHKTSGRIYRLRPTDTQPKLGSGDLSKLNSKELISLFEHPNKWVRRRASLELGWKEKVSADTCDQLKQLVVDTGSLEALWSLSSQEQLTHPLAAQWLKHENADVRRWVIRLLGDRRQDIPELAVAAAVESDVRVRSQLAATARRLSPQLGLSIARQLLQHDGDLNDPHLPLMIWWAIEAHTTDWPKIESFVMDAQVWERPIMRQVVSSRLMRRYAASGSAPDLDHCARLVELAPTLEDRESLLVGLNQAFQGRTLPPLPKSLENALKIYRDARGQSGVVLAVRQGAPDAVHEAMKIIRDESTDSGLRIELVKALGQVIAEPAISPILGLATGGTRNPALQRVALQALAAYDDERIPAKITRGFDGAISAEHDLRATGCRTLASRAAWAKSLLREVNQWRLKPTDVPADVVQRLRTYPDADLKAAVEKAFGRPADISSPEKIAEIQRLTQLIAQGGGDQDQGAALFAKRCANCHRLFGLGQSIGPELDNYDRNSLKFWLPALIAPSIEIREGYQSYVALTLDGRVVTGMIAAQDPRSVTIRTADTQLLILQRSDLELLRAIPTSLMPENLLEDLKDQDILNLFSYLRAHTTP